jgi:hypothetical protein
MYENRMLKANTAMIVIGISLSLPLYAVAAGMPYEQLAAVQGKQKIDLYGRGGIGPNGLVCQMYLKNNTKNETLTARVKISTYSGNQLLAERTEAFTLIPGQEEAIRSDRNGPCEVRYQLLSNFGTAD